MQAPNFSSMVGLGPLVLVVMLSYMNVKHFLGQGEVRKCSVKLGDKELFGHPKIVP